MSMSERILEIINRLGISKTDFANTLKVTPAYISKLINKGTMPSDRLIDDICEKYGIAEEWLRTGKGSMFVPKSKDEEIAEMLADIQKSGEDSFRHRLVSALARLDDDGWDKLEELIDMISNK
jgi:transcriptional regulator with XRE-family HTH domain